VIIWKILKMGEPRKCMCFFKFDWLFSHTGKKPLVSYIYLLFTCTLRLVLISGFPFIQWWVLQTPYLAKPCL